MSENLRLIRLIPVGNGSRRVTLPKEMLDDILSESSDYVAISREERGLLLSPVEIKRLEPKPKRK